MNRKNQYLRLALDFVIAAAFALLFNHRILGGQTFHEIAGLVLGGAVIVHLVLNSRWIAKVSRAVFSRGTSGRTRFGYILDCLLFLDMLFMLVSGIAISKVLFPGLNFGGAVLTEGTHLGSAYLALALMGLHVGMHWRWVMNTVRDMFRVKPGSRPLSWVLKAAAAAVVAFGIVSMTSVGYFQKTSRLFSGEGGGQRMQLEQSVPGGAQNGAPSGGFERKGGKGGPGGKGSGGNSGSGSSSGSASSSAAQGVAAAQGGTSGDSSGSSQNGNNAPQGGDNAAPQGGGDMQQGGPGGDTSGAPQGDMPQGGPGGDSSGMPQGGPDGNGAGGQSSDPFSTAACYLSIMAVFAAAEYYIEKLIAFCRRKPSLPAGTPDAPSAENQAEKQTESPAEPAAAAPAEEAPAETPAEKPEENPPEAPSDAPAQPK